MLVQNMCTVFAWRSVYDFASWIDKNTTWIECYVEQYPVEHPSGQRLVDKSMCVGNQIADTTYKYAYTDCNHCHCNDVIMFRPCVNLSVDLAKVYKVQL